MGSVSAPKSSSPNAWPTTSWLQHLQLLVKTVFISFSAIRDRLPVVDVRGCKLEVKLHVMQVDVQRASCSNAVPLAAVSSASSRACR